MTELNINNQLPKSSFTDASLLNLSIAAGHKQQASPKGPGSAYVSVRQQSNYDPRDIQRAISNIGVRNVPVHLFAPESQQTKAPSSQIPDRVLNAPQAIPRTKSTLSQTGGTFLATPAFQDIIDKVASTYDLEKITPDTASAALKPLLDVTEVAGKSSSTLRSLNPAHPSHDGRVSTLKNINTVVGEASKSSLPRDRHLSISAGTNAARTARVSIMEPALESARNSNKQLLQSQSSQKVGFITRNESTREESPDANDQGSIEHMTFFRRISLAAQSILPLDFITTPTLDNDRSQKDITTITKSNNHPVSVLKLTFILPGIHDETQENFDSLDTDNITPLLDIGPSFNADVNRHRASLQGGNTAFTSIVSDYTNPANSTQPDSPNIPGFPPSTSSTAPAANPSRRDSLSVPNHKIHKLGSAAPSVPSSPKLPTIHSGSAISMFGLAQQSPASGKRVLYMGGHVATRLNVESSENISKQSSRRVSVASIAGKNILKSSNNALSVPSKNSGGGDGGGGDDVMASLNTLNSRRRSVSIGIIVPNAPSSIQIAVDAGAEFGGVLGGGGGGGVGGSSAEGSNSSSGGTGAKWTAEKYVQAFSRLSKTGGSGRRRRSVSHGLGGVFGVGGDSKGKGSTFVEVVQMAADLKKVGMDPSLATELDKDTLTMVLKLKKWARGKRRQSNAGEVLRKQIISQTEQELPAHLRVSLMQDILPIVERYRDEYRKQLGEAHSYSVGSAKYCEKLKAKIKEGEFYTSDNNSVAKAAEV